VDIPIREVVAVVGALIVAWIGHSLGYARAKSERLWETRRTAYSSILFELGEAERVCDVANEYIAEDDGRFFSGSHYTEFRQSIVDHLRKSRSRFSSEYLVLSAAFIKRFEEFEKNLNSFDPNLTPSEEYEHMEAILRKERPLMLTLARDEIMKKSWVNVFSGEKL